MKTTQELAKEYKVKIYDFLVRLKGAKSDAELIDDALNEQRDIDIEKACDILRQLGVFGWLSAVDGECSDACMEEQFRLSMKGE